MSDIIFSHPDVPESPLRIPTGANQIQWSYGLNTQTYPTYGGEVVQILSAYTDNLQVGGDVRSYEQAEHIAVWFINYMSLATQGGGFNNKPVTFKYPDRGWALQIQPISMPGFTYGTETVAPQWQLEAQIVESDGDMIALSLKDATVNGFNFGTLNAGIGFDDNNPFSDPAADPKNPKGSSYDPQPHLNDLADFYKGLTKSYLDGSEDFGVYQDYFSKPSVPKPDPTTSTTTPPASSTTPSSTGGLR